ncbi:MAG: hypothetical protein R3A10_18450 [Caldilineaceae bacterium]
MSLAIVLLVTWIVEMRRPDLERCLPRYTPPAQAVLVSTVHGDGRRAAHRGRPADPGVATVQAASATGEQVVYVVQSGDSLLGTPRATAPPSTPSCRPTAWPIRTSSSPANA